MLTASADRIERGLEEEAVILDVGGWARPFLRADWVMDIAPYETRGMLGTDGEGEQRFSPDTWICRDICDREPYPFGDDEVDFVICSHTLEDIRDPVWVCSEMNRIAKAGYIEVPSRLEEQTFGFQGDLAGWGHHRWLIDVTPGRIEFAFKNWRLRLSGNHFPPGFREQLTEEQRVQTLHWTGTFRYGERPFFDRAELDAYLASFVRANSGKPTGPQIDQRTRTSVAGLLGRLRGRPVSDR